MADDETKAANEPKFRSVLPHEPLPIDESNRGFVHLQGAFEPKRKTSPDSDTPPPPYWKSTGSLEQALVSALRDDHKKLGLPFPVVSVCLIDPNNFTRLRLEYSGPYEALQIQHSFRELKLSRTGLPGHHDYDKSNAQGCSNILAAFQSTSIPSAVARSWKRRKGTRKYQICLRHRTHRQQ